MKLLYYWEGTNYPLIRACVKIASACFNRPAYNIFKMYPKDERLDAWTVRDRSDYFRMKALAEHGGVYFDADTMFLKNAEVLFKYLETHSNWFYGERGYIQNGVMGAKPGNKFFEKMVQLSNSYIDAHTESPSDGALNFYIMRKYVRKLKKKLILPQNRFHGMPYPTDFKFFEPYEEVSWGKNRIATTFYLSSLSEARRCASLNTIDPRSPIGRWLKNFDVNDNNIIFDLEDDYVR